MNNNKVLKYVLIITVIITISLALFYLYNYITTNNEPFVTLTGTSNDINTITGEPKINDDKTINLIVDNIRYTIDNNNNSLQLLSSNSKGFYGIKNNADSSIYYISPDNTNNTTFEKLEYRVELPTNSDGSIIKNPNYKNRTPCAGALLNVSNKTLWYYDNVLNDMGHFNIDGLYYSKLDANGKPILNNDGKIVLQCLRLPLLSTLPLITQPGDEPHAPYDTIKHMVVNDNILFAVGCYETTQVLYYCKLTDGKPTTNDATNWKTTKIGNVMVDTIINIVTNDNYLFIISLTNENNNTIYKIHYNKIEFDSNNLLISNFKELSLINSYTSPKFYVNNNILYIYDINLSSQQINLKYINITDLSKQPLEVKKITFSNEEFTLPDKLMIYKNLLITTNYSKYSILELYNDITSTTTSTTSTSSTTIINKIRKIFNPNYTPSTTTKASGNTTTTKASGTALPNPTEKPTGNQLPSSFVYGSAWGTGTLLNNEIVNSVTTEDGIPINDINFEELSGVNVLINGKENTGNFNDFVSKNRVFGNNLFFISKN